MKVFSNLQATESNDNESSTDALPNNSPNDTLVRRRLNADSAVSVIMCIFQHQIVNYLT